MGNLVFQATLGGQVNLVGPNTASTYNINVPAVSGDMVTTGDTGTVTNTMLAGSIANAKLVNSSFTLGSTAVSLGETKTTFTGMTLTNPTINGYTGDTSVVNIGSGQFYKDTSGNVGIGTSSPALPLHVSSAGAYEARFERTGGANAYVTFYGTSTTGNNGIGTSGDNVSIITGSTERVIVTSAGLLQFDSGYGSVATAYGCRAWVNFNGTGTVAIRSSGNVTSITDNGTGNYTINFTNAMPDANYGVAGAVSNSNNFFAIDVTTTPTASLVRMRCTDASNVAEDPAYANVIIHR